MGVSINYKLFVIIFTVFFFAFLFLTSCKNKSNSEDYIYKEQSDPKPVHTEPFTYKEQYDTSNQDVLEQRFSNLISTQLYYTNLAISQSHSAEVQEFAEQMILEYEHALKEMESLISKEKQNEILFRASTRFTINALDSPNKSSYDRDFLDETIKLQYSIREVLWDLKQNTKNSDLQTFYSKLIQVIELRIDQGVNLLNHV
ncbi:DUF4142 domain-containing protein [Myroides sp. C8-3]|uniref:DUF4142 domain-containing protein n=1 Tax=Myroides sp. C8-3 TaxID=3400533 RepID=UPI003D2F6644